jgi:hypothetical protein
LLGSELAIKHACIECDSLSGSSILLGLVLSSSGGGCGMDGGYIIFSAMLVVVSFFCFDAFCCRTVIFLSIFCNN